MICDQRSVRKWSPRWSSLCAAEAAGNLSLQCSRHAGVWRKRRSVTLNECLFTVNTQIDTTQLNSKRNLNKHEARETKHKRRETEQRKHVNQKIKRKHKEQINHPHNRQMRCQCPNSMSPKSTSPQSIVMRGGMVALTSLRRFFRGPARVLVTHKSLQWGQKLDAVRRPPWTPENHI